MTLGAGAKSKFVAEKVADVRKKEKIGKKRTKSNNIAENYRKPAEGIPDDQAIAAEFSTGTTTMVIDYDIHREEDASVEAVERKISGGEAVGKTTPKRRLSSILFPPPAFTPPVYFFRGKDTGGVKAGGGKSIVGNNLSEEKENVIEEERKRRKTAGRADRNNAEKMQ